MKITKIIAHENPSKSKQKFKILYEKYENHENNINPCENNENHEHSRIPFENFENHENQIIPNENHKNQ